MKNLIYFALLLSVSCSCIFYACDFTANNQLPHSELKCGVARVSGKFKGFSEFRASKKAQAIYCTVSKPLTGESEEIKVEIKADESFSFEIPIETSPTLGYISIFSGDSFIIPLIADEETVIELSYKGDKLDIKWKSGPDFLLGDVTLWNEAFGDALQADPLSVTRFGEYDLDTIKRFIANPKGYIPYSIKYDLEKRLEILEKDKRIPRNTLDILANEIRLTRIPQFINFSGDIWNMYTTYNAYDEFKNGVENKLDSVTYIAPNPDITYWVFLKEFNLNDPHYLYTEKLSYIIQMLLENETLSIPPIEEKPIDEWLKETKNILTDLVGFSDGVFYDILVCNAYSEQFMNRQEPLSKTQIENIKNYYKGEEVEKILLRENKKIVILNKKRFPTVVNSTPVIEEEQLIDTIIAKYKGKVIVLDFWATWCGPCLNAMAAMTEMKANLVNEDIVFVYITTESSPKDKWMKIIPGIGGEHYYLTQSEWAYILDSFNFNGIPTYQFYDKEGKLQKKVSGFSNVDNVKSIIDNLLFPQSF